MKRKVTEIESKILNDGWCLTTKRYTGKHSQKILCYEYHKTSDLRNDGKSYDLFIHLNQKRLQIVKYGIKNLFIEEMTTDELMIVRFLFLELRHYVERLTEKRELRQVDPLLNKPSDRNWEYNESEEITPLTPEQFDELCKEKEND